MASFKFKQIKKKITQYILAYWYNEDNYCKKPLLILRLSTLILVVLSLLYKSCISIRWYLYNKNFLRSFKINIPVIIIGNITVGGNGKTPVVMALVKALQEKGYKPGVILRGYGVNKINNIMQPINALTPTEICGDEAKMIYNNAGCPVIANSDRVASANYLADKLNCNVIISDDGLQHYRLQRDVEVCVVDGVRQFGNKRLLPAGPLREPLSRLNKVNYLLTKGDSQNSGASNIFCVFPQQFINLSSGKKYSVAELSGMLIENNITIYSGLGNNNNFVNLLSALLLNININNIHDFPDHYRYTKEDFRILDNGKNIILTTEKDAVKILELKSGINNFDKIFYLKISAELPAEFLNNIFNELKKTGKTQIKC